MKRTPLFTVVIVALALVLSACGGSTSNTSSNSGGDPTAAAKSFMEALYGGTATDAQFCKAGGAEAKAGLEAGKQALTASGATVDVSGLKYEAANQSGDAADVKVSGKLKVTVAGNSVEQDYPPFTLKMKNEDGGWKVCGMAQ
jgi:predicted small secreted protein